MKMLTSGSLSKALQTAVKRAQGSIRFNRSLRTELTSTVYAAVSHAILTETGMTPTDPGFRIVHDVLSAGIKAEVVISLVPPKPTSRAHK
jgi:16S rRNA C1402 (ribose-2'-O) methylase RsmI